MPTKENHNWYFARFVVTISLIVFLFYSFCVAYNETNVNTDVALYRWALTVSVMYLLFVRFWNTITHIERGEKGEKGDTGATGARGPQGFRG